MPAKQQKGLNKINTALLNALAPTALSFEKDGLHLGEYYCIAGAVTRFPAKASFEWLTEVCNLQNTITALSYTPEGSPDIILKELSNTVAANQLTAEGVTNAEPVEKIRAQRIVADGSRLIDQIANRNESIGQTRIMTLTIGTDKQDTLVKTKATKSKFGGRMFNLSTLPFLQRELFDAISPCGTESTLICQVTEQLLPISTLLGGFPFAFSGYNDGEGCYFGKDSSGNLIVVDTWKRERDRVNSNMVIMGASGGGKSTAIKHLLQNEWEIGTKLIIIDPHGEYKEMCENMGGDWIDVVGGKGGMINPFHIYEKSVEEDERQSAGVESGYSELARHINNLEVFFRL